MMTRNVVLLSVSAVLFLVNDPSLAGGYCQDQQKDCENIGIQGRITQQLSDLSTDFETKSQNFWTDASQTGVRWTIEDSNSAWELNNPAPKPLVGRNYMRVNRGVSLSFGVAVLRSPTIQIPPSSNNTVANISFDFWIRSKWPQFTNLELYLNENGNEKLLVSLAEYSNINNTKWMTFQFSVVPFRNGSASGSEFSLAFYAYCGTDVEDAVAIDNIRWMVPFAPSSTSSTVTSPIWTYETTSLTTEGVTEDETTATVDEITTESWTTEPATTSTPATERPGETEGTVTSPIWTYETTSLTTEGVTEDETTATVDEITTESWTTEPATTSTPATERPDCGSFCSTLTDTNITSPGYPNFYQVNQCYYYIFGRNSAVVKLNFYDIDMGTDDFVKIYDGQSINSPEILKLTGNSSVPDYYEPPKAVVDCFSGYCIIEHFSGSSPKGTLRGWRATYSECGGLYNDFGPFTSISITSPNYPNFYHTNQTCNYTIYSYHSLNIRLEILDFQMEAQHDWFKVYDGSTTDSPVLFQATGYPGFNAPFNQLPDSLPHSVNSSGSYILIEHISDRSDQGLLKGWSVNIIPISNF